MEGFFKALSNRQGDRKSNGTMDFSHGGGQTKPAASVRLAAGIF
jgi:hypothetical protein